MGTMVIDKIINNNIVSCFDETGKEIIVMGRGLGFKMKAGQAIEEEKIEKIFRMDSPLNSEKLKTLLADLPLEHIQVSNDIIHYAKKVIHKPLNKSIYITLTDHLNFAIERYNKGWNFNNALLWEIKRFYQEEYMVGVQAVDIIREKLGVALPEDEAGSIAMHFVNAELNVEMNHTIDITKLIQSIVNIVKYQYNINIDQDSLYYERFITHLKFFSQRVLLKKEVDRGDSQLNEMIKSQYKEQYSCSEKIKVYVQKQYQVAVSDEEMAYLTIHIARITTP